MPQVDVLLPTHARPHTLEHAVASALRQTHMDLEVHVVCDGCSEERYRGVFERVTADPRVRLHRFPKAPGFGYANRNAVLSTTTAPYVAYLTDDDLWFPDHLERGLKRLESGPLDLIAFRSAHIQPPDITDPWFFAFDWMGPGAAFLRHWFTGPVAIVHRRSLFDQLGYWNQSVNRFGDREFYNRVRRSTLRSGSDQDITSLRFFARHWDRHYASLSEPPQKRHLERAADLVWRQELMALTRGTARPWFVRRRQLRDFFAFGLGSGPEFIRFWVDYLRGRKQAVAP